MDWTPSWGQGVDSGSELVYSLLLGWPAEDSAVYSVPAEAMLRCCGNNARTCRQEPQATAGHETA